MQSRLEEIKTKGESLNVSKKDLNSSDDFEDYISEKVTESRNDDKKEDICDV